MEKKRATDYFHNEENHWNCAQAVEKQFQAHTGLTDEEIESQFRCKGGGRAEEGVCGALYAAQCILRENKGEEQTALLTENFSQCLGGTTCQALKGELSIPCISSVDTAATLLEKYLEEA
ncbi:MAG: C-GCAxxG-C-C family (seleno)protein [Phocaeicola sp.]|nr:C-GCAxxG-C-C family (seleno)protein [Phocaeicola sp.]